MSGFLPQLDFLAAGGSIAPPLLLLTTLFLGPQSPLANATVLALGYFTTCTAMGVVGLTVFGEAAGAGGTTSMVGRVISATVGGLLIVFAIPVLALIGLYAAIPGRASTMLGSLRAWMEKNSRANTVVPCSVFGAFFLIRGFSGA